VDDAEDRELLRAVFRGERGLPGAWFHDEARFAAEVAALLHDGWACAGFAHDAAAPGDVHPVELAGLPLLLVRDRDGRLRVFHNVCRHRGAELVREPAGALHRLTCPYHQWSYGLDGSLVHTPHAGGYRLHVTPEADVGALGLREVRSATWLGCVFVDVGGRAAPFEQWLAPAAERIERVVDASLLRHDPDGDARFEVAANWKAIVENYVESYHVPPVHPALQSFNPMAAHYQILGGASYVGQGGTAYGAASNPRPMPGDALPTMPGLVAAPFDYEGLWIAPNLIVTPLLNATYLMVLDPVAAGRTHERFAFFFYGDEAMASHHADGRRAVRDAIRVVNDEDIAIVESCQRGRRSPAFTGGVFLTRQEATSLLVQRIVAARLLAASGEDVDATTLPVADVFHDLVPAR
jgi:choline monooxygenase